MTAPQRCIIAALCAAAAAGCGDQRPLTDRPVLTADEAPAARDGALAPYLTTATDGTVWMSWLEPGPGSTWSLRVSHRRTRGSWSVPRTVVRDPLLFANWADFPSVVVDARGRLVAHFLRRSSADKYSYDTWITTSADSGVTWSAPQRLHSDTSATEHGFAALVPQPDGSTFAAWLDGHASGGAHGEMSLGFAVIDSALRVQRDTMLDLRTCDCCQVAGAHTDSATLFAYRDRSPDDVRDIAVVRRQDGRWTPPAIVHADGWVTSACPVNGPALSASDRRVALAWFTNARDTAKVQLALSGDFGATWGAPLRIDDGRPLGRVDVQLLPDGGALVTWMERTGTGRAEIRARRVSAGGALSAPATIEHTSDARAVGFPRIAVAKGRGVYVAWRELTEPSRLRLALLELPGS